MSKNKVSNVIFFTFVVLFIIAFSIAIKRLVNGTQEIIDSIVISVLAILVNITVIIDHIKTRK